jgi:hypothetical protein
MSTSDLRVDAEHAAAERAIGSGRRGAGYRRRDKSDGSSLIGTFGTLRSVGGGARSWRTREGRVALPARDGINGRNPEPRHYDEPGACDDINGMRGEGPSGSKRPGREGARWPIPGHRRSVNLGLVMTGVPSSSLTSEPVSLRVHRAGSVDAARICRALAAPSWLGQELDESDAPAGMRRFLTDLVLPLPPDGRVLAFRKAAYVDLGRPAPLPNGGCSVEIAWRSSSLAPLFPVFAGRLIVAATGLIVEGRYAPPGGALGRAADRMLLHTAAKGTARWLLGHVADAGLESAPPDRSG